MKNSSLLYWLILIAFILAAIAFLIYRYVDFAEEQRKIYGAATSETRVAESKDVSVANTAVTVICK